MFNSLPLIKEYSYHYFTQMVKQRGDKQGVKSEKVSSQLDRTMYTTSTQIIDPLRIKG